MTGLIIIISLYTITQWFQMASRGVFWAIWCAICSLTTILIAIFSVMTDIGNAIHF